MGKKNVLTCYIKNIYVLNGIFNVIHKFIVGNLPTVSGTVFDLRVPRILRDVITKVPNSLGYDHNFCVTKGSSQVCMSQFHKLDEFFTNIL